MSAASKALRNLSFAKAIGKFKGYALDEKDDRNGIHGLPLISFDARRVRGAPSGSVAGRPPPPGWVPDDHENEFAMIFMEKPPSCLTVRAPSRPMHRPSRDTT